MELEDFKPGTQWYFITHKGTIDNFIIHSGLSPKGAYALGKVHVLYKEWKHANQALTEYNKIFNTFK